MILTERLKGWGGCKNGKRRCIILSAVLTVLVIAVVIVVTVSMVTTGSDNSGERF